MLSVNQMNAQIMLNEMWKSVHVDNYQIKTSPLHRNEDVRNTRAVSAGQLKEAKISNSCEKTFLNDAIHIWNIAPLALEQCKALYGAKKLIKSFVNSLPI